MKKNDIVFVVFGVIVILAILSWYSSRADYLAFGEAAMTFWQTFMYFSVFSLIVSLIVGMFVHFLFGADKEKEEIRP